MNNLNESAFDMYFVYKFSKYMALPWTKWEAFDQGVIDEKGNVVKKHRKTIDEKESYTVFHRLVRKLKQEMEKLPGMKSKLGKGVAAYWLFKEEIVKHGTNSSALDEAFIEHCNENMSLSDSIQIEALMNQHMMVENIK
jgi:hypothetical protein